MVSHRPPANGTGSDRTFDPQEVKSLISTCFRPFAAIIMYLNYWIPWSNNAFDLAHPMPWTIPNDFPGQESSPNKAYAMKFTKITIVSWFTPVYPYLWWWIPHLLSPKTHTMKLSFLTPKRSCHWDNSQLHGRLVGWILYPQAEAVKPGSQVLCHGRAGTFCWTVLLDHFGYDKLSHWRNC